MTVVLGGGIGGLACAYYMARTGASLSLFEASSRVGGWIKTIHEKDTVLETGPRTIRVVGEPGSNTLQLIEEIGFQNEVTPVSRSSSAAKNRMLYVDGKLHSLPNSLGSLFKVVPPFSKPLCLALWKDLTTSAPKLDDDTIYNFVARRFGPEIAEYAVSALVCGVCAGDAKKISVNLLMSSLFQHEQLHGGVLKGMFKSAAKKSSQVEKSLLATKAQVEKWSVWSLKGGLERLPLRLSEVLREKNNVELSFEAKCDRIEFSSNEVHLFVNGVKHSANHVFSSLPAQNLAAILPTKHSQLKEDLLSIPFVTVGVVNLVYDGDVLPVSGFGYLVPPNQNQRVLGVIFDTCCFPQEGKTVLTVMMGGEWFKNLFGDSPDPQTLINIAVEDVKKTLGITQPPASAKASILKNCIPQYIVGHKATVEKMRKYISHHKLPLSLVGSSYDGVGVNDVILSARKIVEELTYHHQ